MLKNKCCLYVIISIRLFSITICNLLIEFPSYIHLIWCFYDRASLIVPMLTAGDRQHRGCIIPQAVNTV